jgi:hypothetical protein
VHLPNALGQIRGVAFCYALLGVMFFVIAAILVTLTWSGSWSHLLHDIGGDSDNYFAWFSGIALGHWTLAELCFRYSALPRWWRGFTLAASLFLALWNIGGAVRLMIVGAATVLSFMPAPTVIGMKWLIALIYSICFYSLWKHRGASNNGFERTDRSFGETRE